MIPKNGEKFSKQTQNWDAYHPRHHSWGLPGPAQDLAREIKKLWGMRVIVIPIVIGTVGTTPKKLKKRLEDIGIETSVTELHKTVILHSARILRKVLEV